MALKFEFQRYTYGAYLSGTGLSSADMTKEYTRLSRQANRNLERIMRSEFGSDQYFRRLYADLARYLLPRVCLSDGVWPALRPV